jgi:hypothetical protein
MTRVIGYTADADIYCVPCAVRLYGSDKNGTAPVLDHEGNVVHPIFSTDKLQGDECCGACHEPITF